MNIKKSSIIAVLTPVLNSQRKLFLISLFKAKLNGNEEQTIKLKEGQNERKTQKHDTKKCDKRGKIFTIKVPSLNFLTILRFTTPLLSESVLFA